MSMETFGSIPKKEPPNRQGDTETDVEQKSELRNLVKEVHNDSQSLPAEEVLRNLAEIEGLSIKEVVEKYGQDQIEFILREINKGKRVIAIGEEHGHKAIEANFISILENLADSGANIDILCLEIPETITVNEAQRQIDAYILGAGDFKDDFLDIHNEEFKKVLDSAKERGVKVKCVGDTDIMQRSATMHRQVNEYADSTDGIVLFYCGNSHLRNPYDYPIDEGKPSVDQRKTGEEDASGISLTDRTDYTSIRHDSKLEGVNGRLVPGDADSHYSSLLVDEEDPLDGKHGDYGATIYI